ncbi:MAG: DUF2892 domain-containing protein [Campylobacterota bacterium]|nr:DUF2892 domain-containing protein [Campylobacterota bacterium]
MCAERAQRILMAIMLGFVMMLAGLQMFKLAFLLQLFIMIMLLVWAFTNFCPSIYILKKVLPPCHFDKEVESRENN